MGTLTPKTASKAPGTQKVAPIVKRPPPPPPGLFPTAYAITLDPVPATMTTAFNTIENKAAYKDVFFALVDMTGPNPIYFGHKDEKQTFIASTAKFAVLYVAIWLRYTLRENAKHITAVDIPDLTNKLKALFNGVARPFGTRFSSHTWPPDIDNIFEITGNPAQGWKVEFTQDRNYSGANRATSLTALGPSHGSTLSVMKTLGFRDCLELMVGWSDNNATARCINSLGFDYINETFIRGGFYDKNPTTGGGLWISRNYAGLNIGSDFQGVSSQSGNAKQLARLMTLAVQKKLVDLRGSNDLLDISDKVNQVTGAISSWIYNKLLSKGKTITEAYSKLGDALGLRSEITYINETLNGKSLKYVISIARSTSSTTIENLGVELAGMIAAAHP